MDFRCLPREFTRHEGACYSGRWEAAAFFYCGSLAGDVITSRLVQFGAGSRTFHEIVEKVVQGAQSYPGLFARVCASLTASLVEMGLESFRHAFREARYA